MLETATTIGVQNTLQSAGTPAIPNVTVPQAGAAAPGAGAASVPATVVTPLTADQQALLAQARAAYEANNFAEARRLYEQLITQNYTNPAPHFGLALTLFAQNDDRGAAFELQQFMALAPDRFEGPYNLGVIASRAGRRDDALKLYEQAAGLMKDQAGPAAQRQVLEALAAEQTRKADFTALSVTLAAIAVIDPQDQDVQYRLAQARTLSGQGAAALPGVYTLLQAAPERVDAALLLADIYVAQGLPDRALRELDAAAPRVKTGADRSVLLLRKASVLAQTGDTRAAVFAAQAATREDPKNATAFAREGELRAARNDRPGALTAYLNAVKLDPQSAAYRAALAGCASR
nr:tetratricopeptide repeat protein [Deinococcus sp. JMULE3]